MHIIVLQAAMLVLAGISVMCVVRRPCSARDRVVEVGMAIAMVAHVLPTLIPLPMIALAGGLVVAVPVGALLSRDRPDALSAFRSLAALVMAAMLLMHERHGPGLSGHAHGASLDGIVWAGFVALTIGGIALARRRRSRSDRLEVSVMWSALAVMAAMGLI